MSERGELPGFGQQCPFRTVPSRELQCRELLHISPLWWDPWAADGSCSLFWLWITVLPHGSCCSFKADDAEKSSRQGPKWQMPETHWCCFWQSVQLSLQLQTEHPSILESYFLDEKLKFTLNNLTLLEKKNSTSSFWRSSIILGNFPLKNSLTKAFLPVL